jgi:hypothetical protein
MDLSLIYIGLGGLAVGGALSVILNVYNKSTANAVSYSIFGLNISTLITQSTIFGLALTIALLSGYSVIVRDLTYPRAQPIRFTIETLYMALSCSSFIFVMAFLRGYTIDMDVSIEFLALLVKFGLLHTLLQFSGIYSQLFPYKKE